MHSKSIKSKKIIIADLDGTLAESKMPLGRDMGKIISSLLRYISFAVITGGSYTQLQKQFMPGMESSENDSGLYLLPTSGSEMYIFSNGLWKQAYSEKLTKEEKKRIIDALDMVISDGTYQRPDVVYGPIIEDRDTQITLSGVGQQAPSEAKQAWDPDSRKRLAIKAKLEEMIPEFEIRLGGKSSVDITRKGIDKAYGIKKITEVLGYKKEEMVFLGDAIFEGGNDYPVMQCGVESIKVNSVDETKAILRSFLSEFSE